MKCVRCNTLLCGKQKKYCSRTCARMHVIEEENKEFNSKSPEQFIKEELAKPINTHKFELYKKKNRRGTYINFFGGKK